MIDTIQKLLAPLRARVTNLVLRGVVKLVDDAKKMQLVQVSTLESVTRDEVENFQAFGFTSHPVAGAEAVILNVGGRSDHPIAIQVSDRRYRIGNLESGEVAMYDASGSTIVMKKNGDIQVTPHSGKVFMTADLKVTGKLEVTGDAKLDAKLDVTGAIVANGEVTGNGKALSTHTHPGSSLTTTATIGLAGVAAIAGNTGAPT